MKIPTKTRKTNSETDSSRITHLESQVAAIQLVLRELAGFTEAVSEDVDELLDGGEGGESSPI